MLLFFSDTTDGKHNCVCGVHHMEYLLTADRLGRNFCEKGRDLCSAGRFFSEKGSLRTASHFAYKQNFNFKHR